MMKLNLLPDHRAITGEYPDEMVDETGKRTFILPRVSRFHGRGNAVVSLPPPQYFATLRVFGDPHFHAFYDRRKVVGEGLVGLGERN